MGGSRWRNASIFLTLIFVLVIGAVSRMQAQTDKSRLGACVAFTPVDNSAIAGLTPAQLSNSLPCAESFKGTPDPSLDGPQKRFQNGFDFLSWLTFLGLNAPADGRDVAALAGDPLKDAPTKWEQAGNFRQLFEVMRPASQTVSLDDWGRRQVPEVCKDKYVDGMTILHVIEEAYNQPFKSGPLIDQNGNYALFDILMNESMFRYIVDNDLFTRKGQASKPAEFVVNFPSGVGPAAGSAGSVGSVMLKVSWRKLDPEKDRDLDGKIHRVKALLHTPASDDPKRAESCTGPVDLGLVGFHVAHKTVNRRQWIWTTFEHVRNVPEQDDVKAGKIASTDKFSFFDAAQQSAADNRIPPRPWNPGEEPFRDGFKSQITRVVPLTQATKDMNAAFQAAVKGTVWENYMLVSTQWPSDFDCSSNPVQNGRTKQPDMTCAPVPTYLANSTLETFSQGRTPLASSSCMSCHNNATSYQRPAAQSDFTFILEKAP